MDENNETNFYINNEYNPYDTDVNNNEEENNSNNNKKHLLLIIILVILILGLAGFIYFKFFYNKTDGGYVIEFNTHDYTLTVGESKILEYKLNDKNPTEFISFNSDNENVVTVDKDGIMVGIKEGTTTVNIVYTNYYDENFSDTAIVNVLKSEEEPKEEVIEKPQLSVKVLEGSTNNWNNSNVKLQILVVDKYEITELYYKLNNDNEINVKNKDKISISKNGKNTIVVTAINEKGKKSTKTVTFNIDKEAPTLTLENSKNLYEGIEKVEVCAKCTDKYSGCSKDRYCKTFTESTNNVTITGSDKANNKVLSPAFDVKINPVGDGKPKCTLKVSETGLVEATVDAWYGVKYKGFNSSYSGDNETSKQLSKDETVKYYVKDKNDETATCSIKVTKTTNYTCPSGYSLYSTNKCRKYLSSAKLTTTSSTTYSGSCYASKDVTCSYVTDQAHCKSVTNTSSCYKKTTKKQVYKCSSGTLSGQSCYSTKSATATGTIYKEG